MKSYSLDFLLACGGAVLLSLLSSSTIWLIDSYSLRLAANSSLNHLSPVQTENPQKSPIGTIKRAVQSQLRGSVYFETGSEELTSESKKILNKFVADIASSNKQLGITLVGHSSRIGGEDSNQQLSDHRARIVLEYLKGRVKYSILAEGKGFNNLLPNVTPTDYHNQRVDLFIKEGNSR